MDQFLRYVINLVDRHDRRREMEKQLRSVDWTATFSESRRPTDSGGFESIGARGCFESHLRALQLAAKANLALVIMEDDLDFSPQLPTYWHEAWQRLQSMDWAIFYAGHQLAMDTNNSGLIKLEPTQHVLCAHFVAFNAQYVSRIVNHIEEIYNRSPGDPRGGPMHVDGAYSTIRLQNPELATYAHVPSLGRQRSSRSDIAPRKFYDTYAPLRPLASLVRHFKNKRS